jgi:uncharacterized protein
MFELFAPLFIGLLGSTHCLGMCGPLVVAYALHNKPVGSGESRGSKDQWSSGILHHIAYHLGRICTYGVLGAGAAGLFRAADISRFFFHAHNGMKVCGGVLLVLLGLVLLKIVPLPGWATSLSRVPGTFLGRWLPPLFHSRRITSKLAVGMATGLLPCCLSWAMIVTAASTQDPFKGWLAMVLFGVGTVPTLLFTGLSVHLLSLRVRFLGERLAALTVIGMGLILVLEGVNLVA